MKGVVFSLFGLILLMCACGNSQTKQDRGKATVQADTVKSYQGELSIIYPGKIKAASEVKLSLRVAGPIRAVLPEVGAFVKKGELIAEIDPRDYEIQLSATEAEYNQVKEEAGRVIELYKRGSVPANDYDKAVSGLKQITAKYNAHKNALADTRLTAPFDGYIQKKFFDAHEIVNIGTPVLSMINNDYYEVNIDIPSSDFVRRESFKEFYCEADVFPGVKIPLELLDVTQQANYNQLFRVRFRMKPEEKLNLAAGMSVSVTIRFEPGQEGLSIIPISSLFQKEDKSYVWVYDTAQMTVKMNPVQVVELDKDGQVIVESDLASGTRIVSAGVNGLREGQKVRLLAPVSSSNVGKLL